MRILVSNDDGIYSPGIAVLAEVASEFGSAGMLWTRVSVRRYDGRVIPTTPDGEKSVRRRFSGAPHRDESEI